MFTGLRICKRATRIGTIKPYRKQTRLTFLSKTLQHSLENAILGNNFIAESFCQVLTVQDNFFLA